MIWVLVFAAAGQNLSAITVGPIVANGVERNPVPNISTKGEIVSKGQGRPKLQRQPIAAHLVQVGSGKGRREALQQVPVFADKPIRCGRLYPPGIEPGSVRRRMQREGRLFVFGCNVREKL